MSLKDQIKRFAKQDHGTVAVEMVLWLPLFFASFILVVDVSIILYRYTVAWHVVEDANRLRAVGYFDTDDEVVAYVHGEIDKFAPNSEVNSSLTGGNVYTAAILPVSDLKATGWFNSLMNIKINVAAMQLVETWE